MISLRKTNFHLRFRISANTSHDHPYLYEFLLLLGSPGGGGDCLGGARDGRQRIDDEHRTPIVERRRPQLVQERKTSAVTQRTHVVKSVVDHVVHAQLTLG